MFTIITDPRYAARHKYIDNFSRDLFYYSSVTLFGVSKIDIT